MSIIALSQSEVNEIINTPGLEQPYAGMTLAARWGSDDGYSLEDQRGSKWFAVGSQQWHQYNDAYLTGVADYISHGDGERLERARLCIRHAKALQQVDAV